MNDKSRFSKNRMLLIIAVVFVIIIGTVSIYKYVTTNTNSTLISNQTPEINRIKEGLIFNVNTGPSLPQMQSAKDILRSYQGKLRSENDDNKRKQIIDEIHFIFEGYAQANIPDPDMAMFFRDIQNGKIK